jgi:hypothetical protein
MVRRILLERKRLVGIIFRFSRFPEAYMDENSPDHRTIWQE